jgi:L-lactate dehydrogenase complex protein LldG
MTAREEILGRIRTALADQPRPAPVDRSYRQAGGSWSADDPTGGAETDGLAGDGTSVLLELLVDRLIDYKATVHRASSETAAEVIATALAERGARRVVVPDGFPAELLTAVDPSSLLRDEPPLSAAELDGTDGVLTTSTVSIAETGTIVLDAGPGQGRRALSLVPDYHLCVVHAADVVRGVPEGVARLLTTSGARPLTWISGPSATSDIELQRVEGVHGPRTLAVVLITA